MQTAVLSHIHVTVRVTVNRPNGKAAKPVLSCEADPVHRQFF